MGRRWGCLSSFPGLGLHVVARELTETERAGRAPGHSGARPSLSWPRAPRRGPPCVLQAPCDAGHVRTHPWESCGPPAPAWLQQSGHRPGGPRRWSPGRLECRGGAARGRDAGHRGLGRRRPERRPGGGKGDDSSQEPELETPQPGNSRADGRARRRAGRGLPACPGPRPPPPPERSRVRALGRSEFAELPGSVGGGSSCSKPSRRSPAQVSPAAAPVQMRRSGRRGQEAAEPATSPPSDAAVCEAQWGEARARSDPRGPAGVLPTTQPPGLLLRGCHVRG